MMTSSSNSSHIYDSNNASIDSNEFIDDDPCFKPYCCLCFSCIYYLCCYFPCSICFRD